MKNPTNEPVLEYRKGSRERVALEDELNNMYQNITNVPLVIGKEKIFRKEAARDQLMVYFYTWNKMKHPNLQPFEHSKSVAKYNYASADDINAAVQSGMAAREKWDLMPLK